MTVRNHRTKLDDRELGLDQHRVLSFSDWCDLNTISQATGRRILASGQGPIVTRLSARRIGITIGNNAAWQGSRALPA
jgi:hypothetical protein